MTTTYTYCSVHVFPVEDREGNLVDAHLFCSDGCHRDYCDLTLQPYGGWNGCHEWDGPVTCHYCETPLPQYDVTVG